jgi:Na+-transporting NADH:ubiquinone oxidoreductase subunit NqrB
MTLRLLLTVHAVITFAAGVVLVAAPDLIPGAVDVRVPSDAYLVCYLLGAAELAVAFLSFAGRNLRQSDAVRLITWTMIVFHGCTAVVEVYAFARGVHAGIWANVALRGGVIALFSHYGLRQKGLS